MTGKGLAQTATGVPVDRFFIKGFVLDAETSKPLPLANIQNKNSGNKYISNRFGAFGIWVDINDTLLFSVLGYKMTSLIVKPYKNIADSAPVKVKLNAAFIKLRDVNVTANKRRQDSLARLAAEKLKTDPLLNNYNSTYSIYNSAFGPFSSFLASGNKKIQEYEKLISLLELYRQRQRVEKRYNVELVMRSTDLKESEALELMRYCNLPDYFIMNSSDYDIILTIRNCYANFKGRRNR